MVMFYIVCYFEDQCVLLEKEEELILDHGQADVGDTVAKAFKTRTLDDSGFERLVDVTYSAVVLFRSQDRSRACAFKAKLQRHMANTKAEGEKFFSAMVDFGKAQFLLEAKTKRGASAGVQKVVDELVTSQTSEPVRKTAVGKEDNRKKRQLSCSEEVLEPLTSRKRSKPPAKHQTSKKQRKVDGKVEIMKKKLDSVARNMEVDALEEEMSGAFWLGEQRFQQNINRRSMIHRTIHRRFTMDFLRNNLKVLP
ncbi:uncharacterized protein LOC124275100 [Haliotis rubra]|uniref:uncharacterized protein LOC124275100 n=1 Tax=Haliotis rubra TaxID=36100 RepID=UPI001EE57358|nr:uncharacterized protein LOC124275100 [Haliotis rubra]